MSHAAIHPGESDVCAVCGLSVWRHPEWVAEAVFEDGTEVYFDRPKDLFRFLRHPRRYPRGRRRSKVETAFVTGYYDRDSIPAREALYVLGSDVVGPLGAELVPLGCRADAEEFLVDHAGERIVSFDEVTEEMLG